MESSLPRSFTPQSVPEEAHYSRDGLSAGGAERLLRAVAARQAAENADVDWIVDDLVNTEALVRLILPRSFLFMCLFSSCPAHTPSFYFHSSRCFHLLPF